MNNKDIRRTGYTGFQYDQSKDTQGFRNDPDNKKKTELCRNWESGNCEFGDKCFFAHGVNELREKPGVKPVKELRCENFYKYGYCISGVKCQFSHIEVSDNISSKNAIFRSPEKPSDLIKPIFIDLESRNLFSLV